MKPLYYTDEGSGTPLVFIHGYCESLTIWSDFIKPFVDKYRVICVDLPGFGKSPLPKDEFSIAGIATIVWSFLDAMKIERCFVIGHSLGGYVSLELANQQPDRFLGFCLFHSTAYPDDETKKMNRTKVMEFVAKNGTPAFVQTLIPSLFENPQHQMVDKILREANEINPATIISYARAMRDRNDLTHVYSTFPQPVLFIGGLKDGVISPESITRQAKLASNKKVVMLDAVAHMGMMESPAKAQEELFSFLLDTQ